MTRRESTDTTTTVSYTATPLGSSKGRENPPHLGDLRRFVEECEGLPDSIVVRITKGELSESGRFNMTFLTSWKRPAGGAE